MNIDHEPLIKYPGIFHPHVFSASHPSKSIWTNCIVTNDYLALLIFIIFKDKAGMDTVLPLWRFRWPGQGRGSDSSRDRMIVRDIKSRLSNLWEITPNRQRITNCRRRATVIFFTSYIFYFSWGGGARVLTISHCPQSGYFIRQKVMGKGKQWEAKSWKVPNYSIWSQKMSCHAILNKIQRLFGFRFLFINKHTL